MDTTQIQHSNWLIIEVETAENECVELYDSIASDESEKKAEPTENKSHMKRRVRQAIESIVWSS